MIRVTVLGAGTMGAQIAVAFAQAGCSVRLWGRRSEQLVDARERIDKMCLFLAEVGLSTADAQSTTERVGFASDLADAVAGADLVVEAITEDLESKQQVLSAAETHVSHQALLASTTSAISPTSIQACLRLPDRFVVAHFAQPAHLMRLVEVVPGAKTSDASTERIVGILDGIGAAPVIAPDIPGFLWARIQHAILREFATLVGAGLATPEACDRVLKEGYAVRLPAMGSFEHADLAGIDLMTGTAASAVWADLSTVNSPRDTLLGELLAKGRLGMKTGGGFYSWTDSGAEQFRMARDKQIVAHTLAVCRRRDRENL